MEQIIEQYGVGLVQIFGGIGALLLLSTLVQSGGAVYMILMQYMSSICG